MYLARPKLLKNVLQAIAAHSLTTVVAPMGYGKSTLAQAVLAALPNAFYYAVPAGPHDGHFVWHDMCEKFEAQDWACAAELRRLGLPESASQAREARNILLDMGAESTTLILDDYHYVTDPLVDSFWERMTRATIPTLRLFLLSRSKPGVNLEDLRLKGLAALFDQSHLAFSAEETEAFFRLNGIEDPVAPAQTQKYSEGWSAVVWLCLKAWQKSGRIVPDEDIDSLLTTAVFAAYSRDEQDFLLRLSVFESFLREDAEKIAQAAGWLPVSLLELRQKNAFLTFDPKTERYQFHSIFRDFLRKRLAVTPHINKPQLYRLAGECCFGRHHLVSALRLFRQAGRDEDLLRLLDCFTHFAEDRQLFFFAEECFEAVTTIPWRVRLSNPLGWLAFVGLYTLMWKDQRTVALLDETEDRFNAAILSEPLRNRILGEIEFVRAFLSFNNPEKIYGHYTEAVRLLDGRPSIFACHDFPWNCGCPNLSFIILRDPGTYSLLPEAGATLMRLYNTISGGKTKDSENLLRAEYFLERGDFSIAEPIFAETMARCAADGRQLMTGFIAAFGLARLSIAQGDTQKALSILEIWRPHLETADIIELFESMDVAEGYVNAVLGKREAIPRWLREGEVFDPPHNVMPQIFGMTLAIHAKALLLSGEYPRLLTVARDIPTAAPMAYLFARLHGMILEALAVWHLHGQNEALELLRQTLELARPDGLVLPIAEYGSHILPLLRRLKRTSPKGSGNAWLEALLRLTGRLARTQGQPDKTFLTPREKEIMRHVVLGKTNPAIAKELSVSINTVKYLIANASAKLGAYGRLSAAKRFIELYRTDNT